MDEQNTTTNSDPQIIRTDFFSIIKKKNYSMIYLKNINNQQSLNDLQEKILSHSANPSHILLNFSTINEINEEWITFFTTLERQLNISKKKLILFYVPFELVSKLKKKEDSNGFNIVPNLTMALEELDVYLGNIDSIKFVQVFVNATIKTFFLEYLVSVNKEKIFIKRENLNTLEGDFNGVFNISDTNNNNYLLFICFPKEIINGLTRENNTNPNNNGNDDDDDDDDGMVMLIEEQIKKIYMQIMFVFDGIKNNITIGNVTVIKGREFINAISSLTDSLDKGYSIVLPFNCEFGNFYVSLWFQELNTAINFME